MAKKTNTLQKKPKVGAGIVTPLTEHFVSSDCGNGSSLVTAYSPERGLLMSNYPHGRLAFEGDGTLGGDKTLGTRRIDYADWYGQRGDRQNFIRYAIGEGITEGFPGRTVETHRNSEFRYGDDLHIFSVIHGIAMMEIDPSQPITLMVPLPPSLLQNKEVDYAKAVKRAFMMGEGNKKDGAWSIRLKNQKDWTTYTIGKVLVVPEGAGAFAAYSFGLDGIPAPVESLTDKSGKYVLGGMVRVVDLGFGTADTFTILRGSIDADSIKGATDQFGGIQTHLAQPIVKAVRELTGAKHITEAHADFWLRQWAMAGYTDEAAVHLVNGKPIEMGKLFNQLCARYAEWISQEKIEPAFREGSDAILATGGGWLYILYAIIKRFPDRSILVPSNFGHLAAVPFYVMNSYGGLVLMAYLAQVA